VAAGKFGGQNFSKRGGDFTFFLVLAKLKRILQNFRQRHSRHKANMALLCRALYFIDNCKAAFLTLF
jgi:hypothetical protein